MRQSLFNKEKKIENIHDNSNKRRMSRRESILKEGTKLKFMNAIQTNPSNNNNQNNNPMMNSSNSY